MPCARSCGRVLRKVDADEFDPRLARRILVVFEADWCGFCVTFLPEFARRARTALADPAGGAVEFVDVDLSDEESPLWDRYDVRVVPTLVAFRDGVPVGRIDGRLGRGLKAVDVDSALALLR